jgi:hypothetical protein
LSNIYRKTLKGIDEIAFKTSGLPLRLLSYLLAVDGEASAEQLALRNQHLPSMNDVLQGLASQGFLEVVGTAANVVNISQVRVSNGASFAQPMDTMQAPQSPMPMHVAPPQQAYVPQPQQQQPQTYAPQSAASGYFPELEIYKSNMTRDISALLGADAAPVIQKIQGCRTRDDLFSTMMGIKKIITIYIDRAAADKFGNRYNALAG